MSTDNGTAKLLHRVLPKRLALDMLRQDGFALDGRSRDVQPVLDGLVDKGLMRRSESGRYWWR